MTEKQWRVCWLYKGDNPAEPARTIWHSDRGFIIDWYDNMAGPNAVKRWIEEREVTYSEPREVSVEEVG